MSISPIIALGFGSWSTVNYVPTLGYLPGGGGTTGEIKYWTGAAFVPKPVKVWNGASWVIKPLKYWNGSSWITTPY